jgi:hypothetical protein
VLKDRIASLKAIHDETASARSLSASTWTRKGARTVRSKGVLLRALATDEGSSGSEPPTLHLQRLLGRGMSEYDFPPSDSLLWFKALPDRRSEGQYHDGALHGWHQD